MKKSCKYTLSINERTDNERYVLYICVKQKPYDEECAKEKQDNQNETLHWCETYSIKLGSFSLFPHIFKCHYRDYVVV